MLIMEVTNTEGKEIDVTDIENYPVPNGCYYRVVRQDKENFELQMKLCKGVPQPLNPCKEATKIAIILESPSAGEYEGNPLAIPPTFKELAPAVGKTGAGIRGLIASIIQKIEGEYEIKKVYDIYIINRVPYQCDMKSWNVKGEKKKVFRYFWNQISIRSNFYCGLQSLQPDIIIEACTADVDTKSSYQAYINKLKTINSKIYIYKHPSTGWGNIKKVNSKGKSKLL